MRKFSWSLLLPVFLLLSQQGELRHEIGHLAQPPATSKKQAPAGNDRCDVCLAYSHLAGAAKSEIPAPSLLSHLAFHYPPEHAFSSVRPAPATPRSRGPPRLLQTG